MIKKYLAALLPIVFTNVQAYAQPEMEDRFALTAGIEIRSLQNFGIFNMDSVVLIDPDNNFRSVYQLDGGFGFGGVVRVKLTRLWNVESGLYFTRRRYGFRINDLQGPFEGETTMRSVAYEWPVKALVYIQLGDQLYMNVAMGAAANFFASDVISLERTFNFRGFKTDWVRLSVLGSVGLEWRTLESGYFYLGATWHQFNREIMLAEVNYFRPAPDSPGQFVPAGRQRGFMEGTYFSIDFKYFIHPKPPKREKYNVVIPDWKNMR